MTVVVILLGHVNMLDWNECVSENKSIRNANMEEGKVLWARACSSIVGLVGWGVECRDE